MRSIRSGKYQVKKDRWSRVSSQAQKFVRSLLVVDPKERLTADGALKHEWIKERDQAEAAIERIDDGMVEALTQFGQASAFRRACMSVMAWSLTSDERSRVRDAFLELDVNRTGTVKLWEFKKVLEDRYHVADEQVVEMFRALDMGHTDEIHYTDFLAAMVSSRIALHDDLIKQAFKRFDVDNSGYITKDNLKAVLGESFDGAQVDSMLREADLTHDGRISYAEWIAYLRGGEASADHQHFAAKYIDHIVNSTETGRARKMHARSRAAGSNGEAHGDSVDLKCTSCCIT